MTFKEYAKVRSVLTAKTKFGLRKVCNVTTTTNGDEAIWAEDLSAFSSIKAGQQIEVIRGNKGNLTILEDTPPVSMNRLSHDSSFDRGHYTNGTSVPRTSVSGSQSNGNGVNTVSNEVEDLLDLPVLSDVDKRNMMAYIRSQSKLLKFCYETICKDFPTLEEYDARGARSLAISLLISANQARDKYMK